MTPAERADLVERYAGGHAAVVAALDGMTDADLDRAPAGGGWTARAVCHHLGDSEATSALRLRALLAVDHPTIHGYDEEAYARHLHYDRRPIGPSLDLFAAARTTSLSLLEHLTEDDWARTGTHTESGPYAVTTWLELYAAHATDHATQIAAAAGRR